MTGWVRSTSCSSGTCVEVKFVRASACGAGSCVEVADGGGTVLVRDGKDAAGPVLEFTYAEWVAFTAGVRAGEFRFGEEATP